jgi:hypothetical protein
MARTWTSSDPRWAALNPYQRAAAMALMEADKMDPDAARNALAAMVNRSKKEGVDLGEHVSGSVYQPTIEPAQQARLDRIMQSPAYADLTGWAERRYNGQEADPVNGATHFLAPESTMLALERQNPAKYRNWGPRGANWTGYDPQTGQYKGVVMRDASHAFLAPGGAYSAPGAPQQVNVAQNGAISGGRAPELPRASPQAQSAPVQFASSETPSKAPEAPPSMLDSILGSLAPQGDDKSPAPELRPVELPELPQAVRRPLDMTRLRQVLASRARLGTGVT